MGHYHENNSNNPHHSNKRILLISFFIITIYMIVEAVGGFLTNSLALLSDAAHMFSDSVSLGLGLLAFKFGEKVATYSKTYGYKRIEILAAFLNGLTLVLISLYIFYEAFHRFKAPAEIASTGMLIIATIGLVVNILVAWILLQSGSTEDNLNMRAAYLHVIGDLLGSVGAVSAALLIMFFGWGWADPLASIIVAGLVLFSGWRVMNDSVHVLMEGTPKHLDLKEVIAQIEGVPGVISIHDLHVWTITSGQNSLSCHVVVNGNLTISEGQNILRAIEQKLELFEITHVTIQLEHENHSHGEAIICNGSPETRLDKY